MIIENPDVFKTWLTSILEPLCDADPAALAKYVYALVKKDKPLEELREGMLDQLDVFLQHETKPFVDMLFKSLETQEYLKPSDNEKLPSPPPEASEPAPAPEEENNASNGTEEPSGGVSRPRSPVAPSAPARHRVVLSRAPAKAAPAPPQPRAPPHEQTLVKVLPLTELLEEPIDQPPRRRGDRRGDAARMGEDRRRRRSRSWERRARPRRHPRDPDHRHDNRRPVSRSPSPRGRYRNRSPPPSVLERPPSRSRRPVSRSPSPRGRYRNRSPPPSVLERPPSRSRRPVSRSPSPRGRYRNRSPPPAVLERLPSRSRRPVSRSPSPRGRYRNRSPPPAVLERPPSRSRRPVSRSPSPRGRYRNRSPPPSVLERPPSRSRRPVSRSPSPRGRYRNRSPPPSVLERPPSRSRRPVSRSPSPRGRYRNRSPPPAVLERPPSRSRSRSPVPVRERDHERERDRLRAPRELERDRISRERDHRDRLSRSRDRDRSRERSRDRSLSPHPDRHDRNDPYKRRCRDFDEKGYCMRGDLCQWDHGADPVVLEDAALTRVLTIPPPVPEYNPLAPDIWMGGPMGGFPPYPHPHPLPHPHPHPPRELIPIPRVRHEPPVPGGPLAPLPPRHPAPPKKHFDYNRLGGMRPPLPANAANCSLEVKKVPRGLNDITHLNNHFSKFGKIVNIQVCYEGDPEGALITFSTPTEANVAYKSTEAVLNNRFIKVFWHNPENKQENTNPQQQNNKQENRPNSQHPMSHNKVLINKDNMKAQADLKLKAAEKAKETAAANGQEVKKEAPPKPIEKTKQVMEMHKRAQALLETQLQQQVLMIQRLEAGNVTGPQKTALMEAINSAQEGIEKLRKELVAYNKTIRQMQEEKVARSLSRLQLDQVNAKKPKTREEAQKEILDAELDMFTKQQEGQDVTELAKKIAELRRQMAIQFPSHPVARRPHARGGRFNTATRFTRGAAAAKVFTNQSVDHRPRALLISGFEADELDALVTHFSQFGEVTGKEVNLAVPELVLQYKVRAHAELAAVRGRHYNDRTLSITWVTNNKPIAAVSGAAGGSPIAAQNGDKADDNTDSGESPPEMTEEAHEEALLRFEDEEDEDAEDRSWRR